MARLYFFMVLLRKKYKSKIGSAEMPCIRCNQSEISTLVNISYFLAAIIK